MAEPQWYAAGHGQGFLAALSADGTRRFPGSTCRKGIGSGAAVKCVQRVPDLPWGTWPRSLGQPNAAAPMSPGVKRHFPQAKTTLHDYFRKTAITLDLLDCECQPMETQD
jgi:hypothetical protein